MVAALERSLGTDLKSAVWDIELDRARSQQLLLDAARCRQQLHKQRADARQTDEVLQVLVEQLSDIEGDLAAFKSVWLACGSRHSEPSGLTLQVTLEGVTCKGGGAEGGGVESGGGLGWLLPMEQTLRTRHGLELRNSLCHALYGYYSMYSKPLAKALL